MKTNSKPKNYDPKDKLFVCYSIYAKLLSERNGTISNSPIQTGVGSLLRRRQDVWEDEEMLTVFVLFLHMRNQP